MRRTSKSSPAAGAGPLLQRGALLLACFLAVPMTGARSEIEKLYPDFVEQVFLTEEGALKGAFPEGTAVSKESVALTPERRSAVEARLGWTLQEKTFAYFKGVKDGRPQGYAVVTEEIGKFKPITFMVKVSDGGRAESVQVMVYREPVGSEVRRTRFTRQFKGKTASDPMRINRDILNLTGATMSVQAITAGVKKTLVLLDELVIRPKEK